MNLPPTSASCSTATATAMNGRSRPHAAGFQFPHHPEALVHYTDQKNVELFAPPRCLHRDEIQSRQDILRDEYAKAIRIEALYPAGSGTLPHLARLRPLRHRADAGRECQKQLGIEVPSRETLTRHISALTGQLMVAADQLEGRLADPMVENAAEAASWCAHTLIPAMDAVRTLPIGWSSW